MTRIEMDEKDLKHADNRVGNVPQAQEITRGYVYGIARRGKERQPRRPMHPIRTLNYTLIGRGSARLPCTLLWVTSLGVSSCPSRRGLDPRPPGPQPETDPRNLAGLGTYGAQTSANRLI
jgi:hypothetical protein